MVVHWGTTLQYWLAASKSGSRLFKGGLETEVFRKVLAQVATARHFHCHRGMHDCEFCGKDTSSGALLFPGAGRLFIAPPMIGHYMESHSHLPSENFITAVLNCPPQDSNEYCDLIEDLLQNRPEGVTFLEKEFWSRAARKKRDEQLAYLRSIGDPYAQ